MENLETIKNIGFTDGTKVYTRDGYKPIEKLQVGDEVLTHRNRYKKIKNIEILMNQIIWKIATINDKILETTDETLLYTSQIEEIHYTEASPKKVEDLTYNDFLVGPLDKLGNESTNQTRTKITSITNTHTFGTIYSIEVEDDNSYMVEKYFVHN